MKFLLDMGISTKVINWLSDNDIDAIHLSHQNLHQLSDLHILEKAIVEDRIILTADMDFGHLSITHPDLPASIIQFRVSDFRPENIIDKLNLIFDKFSDDLNDRIIITVEDSKIRIRKLPI